MLNFKDRLQKSISPVYWDTEHVADYIQNAQQLYESGDDSGAVKSLEHAESLLNAAGHRWAAERVHYYIRFHEFIVAFQENKANYTEKYGSEAAEAVENMANEMQHVYILGLAEDEYQAELNVRNSYKAHCSAVLKRSTFRNYLKIAFAICVAAMILAAVFEVTFHVNITSVGEFFTGGFMILGIYLWVSHDTKNQIWNALYDYGQTIKIGC